MTRTLAIPTLSARGKALTLALLLAVAVALAASGLAQAVPTTFLVINTNDSGVGSLRQGITDANANGNPTEVDTINFAIPATDPNCDATSGVCTISPTTALPDVTETVTIDGYSQPGASPNTLAVGNDAQLKIELNGTNAGTGSAIGIQGPNSTIRGLIINRFQAGSGVSVDASNTRIEGNFIGTDASGTQDLGISGNGVTLDDGSNNIVGGASAAARNLISGNDADGVNVQETSNENRIQGNYLGTDASGTQDLGNAEDGVFLNLADDNVVGGTTAAARNLISGNDEEGVGVRGTSTTDADGNSIQGNYIGTDASGTQDLGNGDDGVRIQDASDNVVGGTASGARNLISGNVNNGVLVDGAAATGNRIEGNFIGTNAAGTTSVGNGGRGVFIEGAPDNVLGGTSAAARNLISGNTSDGVEVQEFDATGNRILRNSISDNGALGIDLEGGTENGSDVTANDPGDTDTGPNNRQNYPVITSATTNSGTTTIQGTLNSTPNDTFTLQFFSSPTADPSGFGEGETFVGQTNVTTNAGGNVAFEFVTTSPVAAGRVVATTATNTVTSETSEFSRAVEVESGPPPPDPQCSDGVDNDGDNRIDFGGANGDPGCSSATDDSESPNPPNPPGCTITGTQGNDTLNGTPGNDTICGLGGNDTINANSGNDTVIGGAGTDTVRGDAGADSAMGGAGADDLTGGTGADKLYGEAGNDALNTRDGVKANDLANGGSGTDSCTSDTNDRKVSC